MPLKSQSKAANPMKLDLAFPIDDLHYLCIHHSRMPELPVKGGMFKCTLITVESHLYQEINNKDKYLLHDCFSRRGDNSRKQGIRFHRFPLKKHQQAAGIFAVSHANQKQKSLDWVSKAYFICSWLSDD